MDFMEQRCRVRVTRGIEYGQARVGFNEGRGPTRERALLMDLYEPEDLAERRLPALVLAFGGAFHRGSREDDTVVENGHRNTPIASYCERFARRGYRCFSIDYRLAQEDPHPGATPVLGDETVPLSRINHVRELLGLAPANPEMMRRVLEAGTDDMAMAYRYVAGAAGDLRVDPERIVVGGFSAGGRISLNAALGERIAPAAVVALSAFVPGSIVERFRHTNNIRFPVFVGCGEKDLDYIRQQTPLMCRNFSAARIDFRHCVVPGATHFYPACTPVAGTGRTTVELEAAIADFLRDALRLTPAWIQLSR